MEKFLKTLKSFKNVRLLYPASGKHDCKIFVNDLFRYVDEFIFCDLTYTYNSDSSPIIKNSIFNLIDHKIIGNPTETILKKISEFGEYRDVNPAYIIERYEHVYSKKNFIVTWRRGFGQFSVIELEDNSLDIFVHRGDSPGEGGSNIYFLGNKEKYYKPISNLFNQLKNKLKDESFIITDGFLTTFKFLKNNETKIGDRFEKEGMVWECFDKYTDKKIRPTYIWKVSKIN